MPETFTTIKRVNSNTRTEMMFVFFLMSCVLAGCGFAQDSESLPGPCPDLVPVKEFNMTKFAGKWIEFARFPALTVGCMRSDFYTTDNNRTMKIIISFTPIQTRQPNVVEFTGRFTDPTVGKFTIDGFGNTVLGTDYTSYLVIWGCNESASNHLSELDSGVRLLHTNGWIYMRELKSSAETLAKAYAVVRSHGLDVNKFHPTGRHYCVN